MTARRILALVAVLGLGGVALSASGPGTGRNAGPAREAGSRPEGPSGSGAPRKGGLPVLESSPRSEGPSGPGAPRKGGLPVLLPVPLSRLDVTQGTLRPGPDGQLLADGPRLRAVVPGTRTSSVELRFTLLGPSVQQVALASGEQRQQVGLKLRAADGCNLLYVMWRIAPKPGIVVNFKRNPGQQASRECGNGGYTPVRPTRRGALAAPEPGTPHTLRATLEERTLRVWADGTLAWEGVLPEEALGADGPVGLRSDNVRLELQLRAPLP